MLEPFFWFFIGLAALIGGAELLVRSASRIAVYLRISKLIIGLAIVAFGTSVPELAVSIRAGINGQTDLMLGNIIGSNITNILLILGISALIIPLNVHLNLIRQDVPIMIGLTLLLYFFAWNGTISFWECLILTLLLISYLFYLAKQSRKTADSKKEHSKMSRTSLLLYLFLGLTGFALLISGAQWLIDSAVIFAEIAGVNELIIGLTVVAIGTSLPEIVTSVIAALQGEKDIAVGSVIGSSIFNILAVLGISGLFIPDSIPVQDPLLRFDLLFLIAASFACIPIFFTGHQISRWEGVLFLGFYAAYILYLFLSSAEHQALGIFSKTMFLFVAPLATITIVSLAIKEWLQRRRSK